MYLVTLVYFGKKIFFLLTYKTNVHNKTLLPQVIFLNHSLMTLGGKKHAFLLLFFLPVKCLHHCVSDGGETRQHTRQQTIDEKLKSDLKIARLPGSSSAHVMTCIVHSLTSVLTSNDYSVTCGMNVDALAL